MRAELEFVVDAQGVPEAGTLKTRPGNHAEFEAVVIPSVSQLRYRPAVLDGVPVRQVVLSRRTAAVMVRSVSSPGGAAPPARTPPHC